MKTGFKGTFVISWAQTELDGLVGAPSGGLIVGATWQWFGETVRVDGPGSVLVLGHSEETANLRAHAAKAVRRLLGATINYSSIEALPVPEGPVLDAGFAVTDGLRRYTATLIKVAGGKPPLVMFLDQMPPTGVDLWVTHVTDNVVHANRTGDAVPSVICFTPETRIATPEGPRLVRDLQEDDFILTKDDGPQRVRWVGKRRMSGARFVAMPELRPIRIRVGALGLDVPDDDLLVSPRHRLLIKGAVAQTLFNTSEVLIMARDLINDHSIMVDRNVREVTYVHLLLDRHQIVFANGLETETFHPASMPLHDILPDQRSSLIDRVPGLEIDACVYGAFARRALTTSEAAILRYREPRAH